MATYGTLPGIDAVGNAVNDPLGRVYTPQGLADAIVEGIAERFRGHDFEPKSAIDPAVGGGAFARALRKAFPGIFIIGVDIDPGAAGRRDCDASEESRIAKKAAMVSTRDRSSWMGGKTSSVSEWWDASTFEWMRQDFMRNTGVIHRTTGLGRSPKRWQRRQKGWHGSRT